MPVREFSDTEKNELNHAPGIAAKLALGSNLQAMQKAINNGGGGGDPYATQVEAEAGTAEDRAMNPLRTAQAIAALAPGGGGAYPMPVKTITADTTLTAADQGVIFCMDGTVKLPATAANGTTYLVVGSPNDVFIDTNGSAITGYGAGTSETPLRPGSNLQLVAFNAPSLIWLAVPLSNPADWRDFYTYRKGDLVWSDSDGKLYRSYTDKNKQSTASMLGPEIGGPGGG